MTSIESSKQAPLVQPLTIAETELERCQPQRNVGFWATFSSTFVTILFAEMGDKTQLATLLISAESHSPWLVFAGAAAALITTSLIGVLLGYWLSRRVSPRAMNIAAATVLLVVSVLLLGDAVQG